ncbi:MAG: hypothetical protein JO051_00310 [Acidobacteriaceae bacterium]|nr:hypothetical protein [Acidobacteriaceae bacterium]
MSEPPTTTVLLSKLSISYFALLCIVAVHCRGDTLSGSGQWEAWAPGQATPQISWCTAGYAGCLVSTPSGTVNYYETGNGNLATPTSMSFIGSAQSVNLSFSFNSAALGPGTDYVGFYIETQAGTIASLMPLFSTATQNSNVLLSVSAGAQYGFYVENVQNAGSSNEIDQYYFMNANLNHSKTGSMSPEQHFALYNSLGTNTYFMGIEDASLSSPNMLFTSMLLTARYAAGQPPAPQAPEPSSSGLAGLSFAALAFLWVRKLHRKKQAPG